VAAGEREVVTENKVVRRLVVSSIAWLGGLVHIITPTPICNRLKPSATATLFRHRPRHCALATCANDSRCFCARATRATKPSYHRHRYYYCRNWDGLKHSVNEADVGRWLAQFDDKHAAPFHNSGSEPYRGWQKNKIRDSSHCLSSGSRAIDALDFALFSASPHASAPNENKMSCRDRERARERVKGLKPWKTRSYAGSRSAPSLG
jgi:hypothetical protein